MKRLPENELSELIDRIVEERPAYSESCDLIESLHPEDRRFVIFFFISLIDAKTGIIDGLSEKPGSRSHQAFWPVYGFALKYYARRQRYDPDCQPGQVAGEVRRLFIKSRKHKGSHVPSQKAIKDKLKRYRLP